MKNLPKLISILILIASFSCNPKIATNLVKHYPPLDYKEEVIVLGLESQVPADAELLGVVKIGDTGFSTNCGYEIVLDKAKLEARKVGGNAIKITKHKLPSILGSPCHRITANILRINNITTSSMTIREVDVPNIDYAILNVYRYSGFGALVSYDLYLGDSVICRVSNNFKSTIKIKKDGINSIWAKTEAKSEVPINIKFGRIYYLRCGLTMGVLVGHPVLELVEQEIGLQEFESIKTKK